MTFNFFAEHITSDEDMTIPKLGNLLPSVLISMPNILPPMSI